MNSIERTSYNIAIIGGGPNCVYALERIAALLYHRKYSGGIHIHIFDKEGRFGCGAVHDVNQPNTSLLNRIACQIGFGCSKSFVSANYFLPDELTFDFMEWVDQKYKTTRDNQYKIAPSDWPPRCVHGEALRDAFENYLTIIRNNSNSKIDLYPCEVTDIVPIENRYIVVSNFGQKQIRDINEVLVVTGNQIQTRQSRLVGEGLTDTSCPDESLITNVYPLEREFSEANIDSATKLVIKGTGVTSVDILLYLTEGRGGKFQFSESKGELEYLPSQREPSSIYWVGRSGIICDARPINQKSRSDYTIKSQGDFFNVQNIENLRARFGVIRNLDVVGRRKQLDFEKHVLPLMILEMAVLYYRSLLGQESNDGLSRAATRVAKKHLDNCLMNDGALHHSDYLKPIHEIFVDAMIRNLEREVCRTDSTAIGDQIWPVYVLRYLIENDYYSSLGQESYIIDSLKFDSSAIFNPLSKYNIKNSQEYIDATLKIINRDLWEARRGNLMSPVKFACDTVWRDYRSVLIATLDSGGLNPTSERDFFQTYWSIHNRIADGPSLRSIEKVKALINSSVVDFTLGYGATVAYDVEKGCLVATGLYKQSNHQVSFNKMCLAYLKRFDILHDSSPLYSNLIDRKLISIWRNGFANSEYGGGISLDSNLNPISTRGKPIDTLTFVGPNIEGKLFFHHTLCRSDQLQPTINNLITWSNRLENRMQSYFDNWELRTA
jgi:hypothetical protein